jgi:citrate lyase beta subunit
MDAKEEARKCASIILDAVHAEVWNTEFRRRVNALSEEDQEALRERIMENELCLDGAMLERLLDEAEIANTLVGEQP